MTIQNLTGRHLYFGIGTSIPHTYSPLYAHWIPGEKDSCTTHHFHSDSGSLIIKSDHGQREIKSFGNLTAKEIPEKDNDGLKIIVISDRYGCI